MDENDSRFIKDLSAALGNELKVALDSTFGIEAEKAHDEARLQTAEQKAIEDLRTVIMQETINIFRSQQQASIRKVSNIVSKFLGRIRRECGKALDNSPYLFSSVNYDERYKTMQQIGSSDELLKRIEQTIDAQEQRLKDAQKVDVARAVRENAELFLSYLEPLKDVQIDKPGEPQVELLRIKLDALLKDSQMEKEASSPVEDIVKEAFAEVYGSENCLESDAARFDGKLEAEREVIIQAVAKASERALAFIEERAETVAGKHMFNKMPEPFIVETLFIDVDEENSDVALVSSKENDEYLGKLKELLRETRTSFKKYSQCIKDNGIFSAFPEGGKYGEIGARRAESYNCYDYGYYGRSYVNATVHLNSSKKSTSIPDVFEKQSEDDIDTAITRLKKFNAKPYWGALDDNVTEPVDAFWYGFKELMVLSDEMSCINLQPYYLYLDKSCETLMRQAAKYGACMDEHQVEEFRENKLFASK